MRIALYPNKYRDPDYWVTRRVAAAIAERGAQAVLEKNMAPELESDVPVVRASYSTCDLMIILGGDGTFLSAAHLESARDLPKTGINLGSVGFLLEVNEEQIEEALDKLLSGDYIVETRALLSCSLKKSDGTLMVKDDALNDIVVARGNLAKTISVGIAIDGDPAGNIPGDGIIVATPTGSTAYSLSVGGPILDPSLDAIVVSAICPHTLHDRSFVLRSDAVISLCLLSKEDDAFLTVDGRACFPMDTGDRVTVKVSPRKLCYLRLWEDAFFKTLPVKIQKRGVSR